MNYQKIYNNLIEKRKKELLFKKQDYYCENHHIIPVCLGGLNDKENLVNLYAREHFICHLLLCKIYPTESSLFYALWRLCNSNDFRKKLYKISAREYEKIKIEFIKINISFREELYKNGYISPVKNTIYINNGLKQYRIHINELNYYLKNNFIQGQLEIECFWCKRKIPINTFAQYHGDNCVNNPKNKNRIKKEIKKIECEKCHKIVDVRNYSRWHGKNCGKKVTFSKKSIEKRNKTLEKKKENGWKYPEVKLFECPYCYELIGGKSNFNRWHNDNCLQKPGNENLKRENKRKMKKP
jgi:hypothetical protein